MLTNKFDPLEDVIAIPCSILRNHYDRLLEIKSEPQEDENIEHLGLTIISPRFDNVNGNVFEMQMATLEPPLSTLISELMTYSNHSKEWKPVVKKVLKKLRKEIKEQNT